MSKQSLNLTVDSFFAITVTVSICHKVHQSFSSKKLWVFHQDSVPKSGCVLWLNISKQLTEEL